MENLEVQKKYVTTSFSYCIASIFLLWHSIAIFIAPFPPSIIRDSIYPPFQSYLWMFYMENFWSFFAPGPLFGRIVNYKIWTKEGENIPFVLTIQISKEDPNFLRRMAMVEKIRSENPLYTRSFAQYLCHKHRALNPEKIQFVSGWQKLYPVEAYRNGASPINTNFLQFELLPWINCGEKFAVDKTDKPLPNIKHNSESVL